MILSSSPATPRILPITRESSREDSTVGSGESSKVAATQDVNKSEATQSRPPSPVDRVNESAGTENIQATANNRKPSDNNTLSEGERKVLEQLKSRDREVRAHEAAHLAAAGSHATSGASFSYQSGPDGQRYAIGGEVGVSVGKVAGDPEATLAKAEQVRAAALAPANPSSQDRAVAVRASQLASEARQDIADVELVSEETASSSAETAPRSAEATSSSAETAPVSAETAPRSGETASVSVETAPRSAETASVSVETAPRSAEATLSSAETASVSVETAPRSAETAPASVETAPRSAETAPASVETAPRSAETAPASVETAPRSAETTDRTQQSESGLRAESESANNISHEAYQAISDIGNEKAAQLLDINA